MRSKERIEPILKHIDWEKYLEYLKIPDIETYISIPQIVKNIQSNIKMIEKEWKNNPDWRLTQVLVNTGILPNLPGFWYYQEDIESMMNIGIHLKEIMF